MADWNGRTPDLDPESAAREALQLHRQLRRVERDYAILREVHGRQSAALREVNRELRESNGDQERTIALLRSSLDDVSARLQDVVAQDEDQIERYARRVGLLALRERTLSDLRGLRAASLRRYPPDTQAVLPRRASRGGPGRPWPWERRRLLRLVAASGLFSPDWYRAQYPDCSHLGDGAALAHFVDLGLSEDRDPHPLFSAQWVRAQSAFGDDERRPFVAFLQGAPVQPHPLFDVEFYLATYRDVRDSGQNALVHYVRSGAGERRQPHPAFDPHWYVRRGGPPDVADLLSHYLVHPDAASCDPHPLFRADHYLAQTPEVQAGGAPPLLHYIVQGWRYGLSPHPLFETAYYLDRNRDVEAAGVQPFLHFLASGSAERRQAHPLFDTWWYLETNPDVLATGVNPLVHYVLEGAAEGRSPGPAFPAKAFGEAFPDSDPARREPIELFLSGEGLRLEVPRRKIGEHGERPHSGPDADDTFWLTDLLREYVSERYGPAAVLPLYDLMHIVTRFGDHPLAFEASEEISDLTRRVQDLADRMEPGPIDVTVIVPVHNALVFTLTSVVSLLESETRYRIEILIADDASSDLTEATFSGLGERVQLVRQPVNVGFLENCNLAAGEARGRYLVFLNNDTIILPGWLDQLIETFERDPRVGYAGSKLLNGDGSLQEAGGILWRDGSGWNYGRGQNPWLPEFNYVKDVDYCSGASIAIPKHLWDELGGFDPIYKPAYCEDSDLAFRVRAAGFRSVYQPLSELVHHEGRSHGRDEASGIKAYQVKNQQKFFARWSDTLDRENLPHGFGVNVARDRSRSKPHVLIVDHYVPQWDRDAGSRTIHHFIRAFLARGFHVTFWPDNLYRDPIYAKALQLLGVEVIYGPEYVDQFESWFSARADLFQYVLLSRPHIALNYIEIVRASPGPTVMFYGHDLHWQRLMDQYAVTGRAEDLRDAERFRAQEVHLARKSSVVLYPSETERDLVRQTVGPSVYVGAVPAWVFDENELAIGDRRVNAPDDCDPFSLLFVGGFNHPPNSDGVRWFMSGVFGGLRTADDRFSMTIVGSNPGPEVRALAGPGVVVTGQVSDTDLARLYERAGTVVVPLRFGGGVKGKVIEAFSKGAPVVSTNVGLQGIPDPARLAFVADEANAFTAAVLHAARDRAASTAKASRALGFLRERYSAGALAQALAPVMPEFRSVTPSARMDAGPRLDVAGARAVVPAGLD